MVRLYLVLIAAMVYLWLLAQVCCTSRKYPAKRPSLTTVPPGNEDKRKQCVVDFEHSAAHPC